jgi:hypothetical protein
LRQVVHFIRYNESDEKILAVAGQQARAWARYQYMPSISDFEQCEITVRVNVGIGAMDPMQRLAKLKMAGEMLTPMYPMMQQKGITPNVEAFIEEVMGHAGFRDGKRFFNFGQPQQPQPPPEMQAKMAELQQRNQALQAHLQEVMAHIKSKQQIADASDRTKLQIESMRGKREVVKHVVGALADREERAADFVQARHDRAHEHGMASAERLHDLNIGLLDRRHQGHQSAMGRGHEATQGALNRKARISEILAGRTAEEGGGGAGRGGPLMPSVPRSGDPMAQDAVATPMMDTITAKLDAIEQRNAGIEQALQAIMQRMIPPQMQAGA